MRKRALLSRDELRPDDLLTLAQACEVLLNGHLTPASLRRERDRGNLVTERIAGKEFMTPAEIEAMRERCRFQAPTQKLPSAGGSVPPDRPLGLYPGGEPVTSQDILRAKLRKRKEAAAKRRGR
ncbi:MAG: excisionase [Fulvimarina sp.]|nr:excisionase [Fulvimarina sp.]